VGGKICVVSADRTGSDLAEQSAKGSIDGWLDFEEAFFSNFSSTYKRSNRPQ
jgi:hypothetical protein